MLMLNEFYNMQIIIALCNLNTSHVNVKLKTVQIVLMFCSDLNTSHVNVKSSKVVCGDYEALNLNTSHVNVKYH